MTCNLNLTKISKIKNLFYILFFANFFLGSCSTPPVDHYSDTNISIAEREQIWMEKFFREFFLKNSSIYTLFGSKPISAETLIYSTEEEYKKWLLSCIEKFKIEGEEKEKILSEGLRSFREDDFRKNWEKWLSFFEQFPNSPFLFATHPTLSQNIKSAHILNVQETIWILQKHYNIFRRELGFDFDPVLVTMDFKNEDSLFWKKVFSNHLLTGIVYGFGVKNSYFFNLSMGKNTKSLEDLGFLSTLMKKKEKDNKDLSVAHIILPRFRSFGLPFNSDPVLEKYNYERDMIKKKLNDTNFFKMVFLQLTGDLSKETQSQ